MSKSTENSGRYTIFIVVFMGLVGLMDNYLALIENVAVTEINAEFGLLPEEFAFWQAIFGIITFSVFFIGWFTDAFGRKKGVLVLMLVMGVPALLIGLTANTILLFFILYAIVITGTLSNMWEIPVTEESPPERRATYGGIATLMSLIPIYAILGPIIADNLGWRWTYGIMFFFMLGLLILWYFMREPKRWLECKEEREHKLLKIKEALKRLTRKDVVYIAVCTIVYGIWTISFKMGSTWGRHYYENVVGIPSTTYRTYLTIAGFLTMFGALTSGILMDKIGRNLTLIIGCIGSILGFLILAFTASPVAFWMVYFFMPVVFAWIMIYFAEVFRTEIRSTAVGIAATGARVSYVVGPLIASILLAAFPTMEWFWIVGGLFMLVPIASLLLKPFETKGMILEDIQEKR